MKKFYTAFGSKALNLFLALGLITSTTFAQTTPICGPIVENFNNTSGSNAGFTGDLIINSPGAGMGNLKKDRVIAGAVYSVTTPTYQLAASSSYIGYGFLLDGTQRVARVEAAIMYRSTLNDEIITIFLGQFVPSYSTGTPPYADVCRAIATSDLPGFPTSGQYRLRFELTPNTGLGQVGETVTFDDFRTNGNLSQAPLPVTFIGFEAKKTVGGIALNWKVGGEENVNRYEVERSTDGRNYTTLGTVSTTKSDNYSFVDGSSVTTAYYRIKNVDNDGRFKYSTVARLVNGKSQIVIKAFPQPVMSQLTIQHPSITGNGLISVSSADGRLVKAVKPVVGSMQSYVDMSGLQKGMYMIRFDAGDGSVETMKVIKQ